MQTSTRMREWPKVHNPLKRLFGHEKKSAIGRLPKQIPRCLLKILFLRGFKRFQEVYRRAKLPVHCGIDRTLSYSASVHTKFQNSSKFCSFWSIFGRHLRKIGICFGNWLIADFFHDQTIFLKDYELYIRGHSLLARHQVCHMT